MSAKMKTLNWFISETGQKVAFYAAGALSCGVMLASFLPHTVFMNTYQDIVHLYKNGYTVPLSPKLVNRFQKTLDLLRINEIDKPLYKPFSVYGLDVFSAGAGFSRFGIIVGLPINFTYESVLDVDRQLIRLQESSIAWDTTAGEELQYSLVLSEKAQMYAMAREIKMRETPKCMLDVFFNTAMCVFTYGMSNGLNKKYNLYSKPRSIRFTMYGLVFMFVSANIMFGKDLTQIYFEKHVDKSLVETDPVFVEGGKEFYTKILQRNVAFRKLLGKEGEAMYSALGNENYLIRQKHLPLVQRRDFFEQTLPA